MLAERGLEMASRLLNGLMSTQQVAETFRQALEEKRPINHVNLGDGEIIFLAFGRSAGFEKWPSPSDIEPYFKYISDPTIRDAMLDGVLGSYIIGMPARLYTGDWSEAEAFLNTFSIPTQRICDSYTGRLLHNTGLLYEILKDKRVCLLGNHVDNLVPFLENNHIEIGGQTEVNYFEDIPRVQNYLSQIDFDIAILSAGMPTLILSSWIRGTLGRCALDFGSAINFLS